MNDNSGNREHGHVDRVTTFKSWISVAGVLLLACVITSSAAFAQPIVRTDRSAYQAGDVVQISGSGFAPSEIVTLQVTHAGGGAEIGRGHDAKPVVASADGSVAATWSIDPLDRAGNDFVVSATGSAAATVTFKRFAQVQTDKFDYKPRSTASIAGAGFLPNEIVTLQVLHANGKNTGTGHGPFTASSDASGRITSAWYVPSDDSEASILILTAVGSESGLKAVTIFLDPPLTVIDDAGPDDEPGQKDLSAMTVDFGNLPTTLAISWNWDDTAWSGNNTGDACALFDTDKDGFANYAICVTVEGAGTFKSTRTYSCTDGRTDRCTGPTLISSFSTCAAGVSNNADPFRLVASHLAGNQCSDTPGCRTADTVAACTVNMSGFGGATSAFLLNVCSYPSQEPNSDPSDCVVAPNSGFLTIVKVNAETGDTTTVFTFNTSRASQSGQTQFQITGSGSVPLISFSSGTVDLSEVVPTGWQLDSAACALGTAGSPSTGTKTGSSVTGVTIQQGIETTCTFTNSLKKIYLTLAKEVTNDNGGTAVATAWTLSASGPTPISGTNGSASVTAAIVGAGTYTLSESGGPSGYLASDYSCVKNGGTAVSGNSISLVPGDTAVCTIKNDDIGPKLTVTKVVVNDNGGTKVVSDFVLKVDATTVTSGVQGTFNAGSHTVSETSVTGYTGVISGDCAASGAITLALGDVKSCTITNDDVAAKLTVTKVVVNDNGGTKQVSDFVLKVDATTVTSGVQNSFGAGAHVVSEVSLPGYTSVISGDCASDGSITLSIGDVKACTITNDDVAPKLTVTKVVINNNGGTKVVGDFVLNVDGTTVTSGIQNTFNAGTHTVGETAVTGYTGVITGDCAASGAITLNPGDVKTCTITNDDQAASLSLVKVVINNNGGTALTSAWTLAAAGPTPLSGAGGASGAVSAGTYTLSETGGPAGYSSSAWSCAGGSQSGNQITLALGQSATCTITNDDIAPTLTIAKICAPTTDTGKFNLLINGVGSTNTSCGQSFGPVALNAGTYVVSETAGTGTTLTDYVSAIGGACAANGSITLGLAGTATCTITNTRKGKAQVIKTSNGGSVTQTVGSGFVFQLRSGASATQAGTTLESAEANAANGGTLNFNTLLVPGTTYSLCEVVMPGWTTTLGPPFYAVFNPSGDNSTVCSDFTVTPGETKIFTINNLPPPGGLTRTIGFWKNWSSCTGGRQKPILDQTLALGAILIGDLTVDTCAEAVSILSKETLAGKKAASDPAFNLAAQLLAAKLNVQVGAGVCAAAVTAINDAQTLLALVDFDGLTTKKLTPAQATQANTLAGALDKYNQDNTALCQ